MWIKQSNSGDKAWMQEKEVITTIFTRSIPQLWQWKHCILEDYSKDNAQNGFCKSFIMIEREENDRRQILQLNM